VLPSVDTSSRNAVVRQVRQCAAVQTPVNCHCQLEKHPVGDVEPVKFVMQYLTQAEVKLLSAGDDRHAQQRSTHAVTCPLLSLVHQHEQCCSNQSVNLRVYPTSWSPTTAGDVGVDAVGSSSPRRCERRGDPDSDHRRCRRRADEHGCRQLQCSLLVGVPDNCH